jgi:flavin reductase (DIM6/NTAB) family NADH-FMN oxidoreductase RutF
MDFSLINPRQTVLVTCRGKAKILGRETHRDNAIAVDWHMPVSFSPGMYAISITKSRFSYTLIAESKVFAVNFMQFETADKVLFCGRHSGQFIDKFKDTGLAKGEAGKIDCPIIADAVGWVECTVEQEIEAGDHVILIGKIVAEHMNKENVRRVFHLGENKFLTIKDN